MFNELKYISLFLALLISSCSQSKERPLIFWADGVYEEYSETQEKAFFQAGPHDVVTQKISSGR